MGIKTIIQKKFQNLFVCVVFNENECTLCCKVVQNNTIKKTFSKTFSVEFSQEALDQNVENYIIALQEEYQLAYIVFLLNSMGQGAIEGCNAESFTKYDVDMQNVHHTTISNLWSAYASHIEIKWAKNLFSEIGLDLIYSPFIILNDFVISQKPKNKPTCYILNCQDFFVLAIFEDKKVHFGAFFKTQSDTSFARSFEINDWENEKNIAAIGELPEIEETDNDEMSDLVDIDDMKILGHFQGIHEVSQEDSIPELYGRDLLVYKYLKSSLEEYYHNPVYKSEFIEEIVIFDGDEISSDLIYQLEDELMMDVEIHKIDVADRMCDIAIKEIFA